MEIGMMWFDDDKIKPLEAKVMQAVEFYAKKYGRRPNACLVNSAELAKCIANAPAPANRLPGLRLEPMSTILPHHYWVGIA